MHLRKEIPFRVPIYASKVDTQKNNFSGQELSRTVSTSWGVVVGELVSPGTNDLPPVTQYLGIPYGSAPVGSVS